MEFTLDLADRFWALEAKRLSIINNAGRTAADDAEMVEIADAAFALLAEKHGNLLDMRFDDCMFGAVDAAEAQLREWAEGRHDAVDLINAKKVTK